jgi:predicted transcriptional regulator
MKSHMKLSNETQQYIEDQVKNGNYPTPEAVIEAAIADMQENVFATLDDETIAAINEGEEQADRGEGIDLDVYRDEWRKRLGSA